MLRIFLATICIAIASSVLYYSHSMANTMRRDMPINISYHDLAESTKKEIDCLAENIYFESAHEPTTGKIGVAFVTINRTKSDWFPDSICSVVKQRTKNVCQFSWYCESGPKQKSANKVLTKTNNSLYNDIRELAVNVYMNHEKMKDPTKGALFYHADYVNPRWPNMERTAVIGRHIFYNKRGLA
jgi:spore germination cell wall hydrolase CwlJ-like protein